MELPTATELDDASKHLDELMAEQAKETPVVDADDNANIDAPANAPVDDKDVSAPKDQSPEKGTLSDAEAQEVTTAKAAADKEGKELDLDDKGQPKRDSAGKFVKKNKVAVVDVAVKGLADQLAKMTKQQQDAVLDALYPNASTFAKDNIRKDRSWKALNAEKAQLQTEKAQQDANLKGALAKFNADVEAFKAEQESSRPSPEKYETWANQLNAKATLKEAEAVKLEADGKYDEAQAARNEVLVMREDARRAVGMAEQVRKNPPATLQQQQAKFQTDQRSWTDKASIDFPEFGKRGSVVQNAAIEFFQQTTANDPVVAKLPGFIYFCAERAALKTAADRVPSMEKELGELRTKVQELTELTSVIPSGGVQRTVGKKSFEQMTPDEQYASLREEAGSR